MFAALKKYFSPVVHQNEKLSLLQIFKPIYVLLSTLGLFPQAILFSDDGQDATFAWCRALFMIILIHSFYIFHLHELYIFSKENSITQGYMTLTNYIIDLSLQVLSCTVSYFHVIRDRNLYSRILKDMADLWDRLAKGRRRQILGQLRVQMCALLCPGTVIIPLLLAITYRGSLRVWKKILFTVTFILPELIQFLMISFYLLMILMIVALLKNIEEEIKILALRNNICYNLLEADELGMSILKIKNVYVKTLKIKRQVNAAFEALILVAMAVCFHELVGLPHMIYHGTVYVPNFSINNTIGLSLWVLTQLLKMSALAISGALLNSQVNKIRRAVYNIPISRDQDLKAYLLIQHFSSLMSYQNAQITVYGYFSLDGTLIFRVVASAVMYLTILVQFDQM
ncbi:gustatory receptor 68a-like [Cydia pomonella]|uniref:gustatory receptor 68a-like n=1 Tax=Cydia pomonella TaxID=82600 RepID=UPI002ADDF3A2|nr:gustatory receptor 68a-like [Cydia pomonella]